MLPLLLAGTAPDGRWRPGLGDPTIVGFLTTLAYFAAAGVCALAWRRERFIAAAVPAAIKPRFWLALALVMAALGINKQLDLQTLFTQLGRDAALAGGWYKQRHIAQVAFILVLATAGATFTALACWYLRRSWRRYALAIIGIAYLLIFILIRASSFHHTEYLLFRLPYAGRWVSRTLELGGIAFVGLCAWRASRLQGRVPLP
jgi:hypothetical protein